jgi:class 3 adenylate cyclase
VDDSSRGALTAAGLPCGSCGTELLSSSKFCNECGAPVIQVSRSAEYKQVTVLFADVVHSMDIAATVGPERLREIMTELVERSAAVVKRYGGAVDKFTGDGIMAVFGAPVSLEDHAVRACLAALGVQEEAKRLAVGVHDRDGVDLRLRVGLNSGQVIAGEIGSGALGYTAVGEQVGMAQRMESVAAPDGVMLSASTARLVADLGDSGFGGQCGFGSVNKVGVYPVHEATEDGPATSRCRSAQPRWCSVEGSSRISAQAVDSAEAAKSRPHSRRAAVRAEQLSVLSPWLARWTSAHAIANTGTRLRWAAPSSSLNAASESHRRMPIKMPCAVFSMQLLFKSEGI